MTWLPCGRLNRKKFSSMLTIIKLRMDYSGLSLNYDAYKANGGELSKLKYIKAARQAIRKAIEEDIIPLMSF